MNIKIKNMKYLKLLCFFLSLVIFNIRSSAQVEMLTDFGVPGYYPIDVIQKLNSNFIFYVKYNGIWKTDGTKSGTEQLFGPFDSSGIDKTFLNPFGILNGKSIFLGNYLNKGYELWESDGTKQGTKLIVDFFPNYPGIVPDNCEIEESAILGNYLYFKTFDNDGITSLMRTDGTALGTEVLISNIDTLAGTFHPFLTPVYLWGNQLYFCKDTFNSALRIYTINIQNKSIKQTAVINNTFRILESKVINDSIVIMLTQQPKVDKSDLYSFNLNTQKITNLKSFVKGIEYDKLTHTLKHPLFHPFNGIEYFFANGDQGETELWKTDGTLKGTQSIILMDPNSLPYFLLNYNSDRFFYASINNNCGIYKIDNQDKISNLLTFPIYCTTTKSNDMLIMGDDLLFDGSFDYPFEPGNIGSELYAYNFTTKDTNLIVNLNMKISGDPINFVKIDENNMLFDGSYDENNNALYRYTKIPSSTKSTDKENIITVFPIPVHDAVTIKLSEGMIDNFESYIIYDMIGRSVKTGKLKNENIQSIDLKCLSNGNYIINFLGDKKFTAKKIMKN